MQVEPAAVLAVISEQATRIASLERENQGLREALASAQAGPQPTAG